MDRSRFVPRFAIRRLMIAVAIVAIAPVAAVNVYNVIERRSSYSATAENWAFVANLSREKMVQLDGMADAWSEQSRKGLVDDPTNPGQPEGVRQERIARYRKMAEGHRTEMRAQLSMERKYRRAMRRPWAPVEPDPPALTEVP